MLTQFQNFCSMFYDKFGTKDILPSFKINYELSSKLILISQIQVSHQVVLHQSREISDLPLILFFDRKFKNTSAHGIYMC